MGPEGKYRAKNLTSVIFRASSPSISYTSICTGFVTSVCTTSVVRTMQSTVKRKLDAGEERREESEAHG